MDTRKTLLTALACVALSVVSALAHADPVRWTFVNATALGGTIAGSFVYDADTDTFTAINVTTSGGGLISATHNFREGFASATSLDFTDGPGPDFTGLNDLYVVLSAPMTNAGGDIPFAVVQNGVCADASCGTLIPGSTDVNPTGLIRGVPLKKVFNEREPGSALVYPLFDVNDDPGNARSTLMKLSNLGDAAVWVHFVRVCAGVKSFGGEGLCQASNRQAKLTPGETFVRDVASWFSIDRDNCPTGYIVAYAQASETDNTPMVWNHLLGSVHMNSAGALNQRTSGMQAYAFQALGRNHGGQVVGALGGVQPVLPFDGVGYTAPATTYWTDYLASIGQRYSELTLLTLDITAGTQNQPTLIALDAWNQSEEYYSGAIEYVCHVRVRLDDEINAAQPGAGVQGGASFGKASNLGSTYGLLQMTPLTERHAILGAIMEQGQNRQTLRGLWHDEVARPTTFFGR